MKTSFQKITKKPSYRILAEAMTEQILDGRLSEGDQLPTEAQLCEIFGVNRSTVREGIRVLEEANLIRRESPKRLVVSHPSNEEVGDQLERALILRAVTFDELWEAIYILEPAICRIATKRPDAELLRRLEENVELSESAHSRGESLVALDIEFHHLIATLSENRALILSREPLSRLFYPTFRAVMEAAPEAGARLVDAHRLIVDSIRRRNATDAEDWMRRHILDFKRGYQLTHRDLTVPVSLSDASERRIA